MIKKQINKESKTLTAGLLLYGFHESSLINEITNEFYSVYNFIKFSEIKIIEIKINKYKAEYKIRSNIDEARVKNKPITKDTLSFIIKQLTYY